VQKVAAGSVQKDLNHSAFKTIEFKYPKNKEEQKVCMPRIVLHIFHS
jgi:type I restriction enzyme S subunit